MSLNGILKAIPCRRAQLETFGCSLRVVALCAYTHALMGAIFLMNVLDFFSHVYSKSMFAHLCNNGHHR